MSLPSDLRVFSSTGYYVQGPGAIAQLGSLAARHGNAAVVVIDGPMHAIVGPAITGSLTAAGVAVTEIPVTGEVKREYFERLAVQGAGVVPAGCVVAVGGGKAIDIGKGVAMTRGIPVITVPTVASNDSPASKAIAIYDDAHQLEQVAQLGANPVAVVVDTAILIGAPRRFLSAGIGDAIAKRYEAQACAVGTGITPQGTRPLGIALAIARDCAQTLRQYAPDALRAVDVGVPNVAFENTVEAVILMSGLGFENGGLSIAHSMTRGLMLARGARTAMHGEHVAYGLLVQLALDADEDDAELLDMIGFLTSVDLPTNLGQLGLDDPNDTEIDEVVSGCLTSPHLVNFARPIGRAEIREAMARVERVSTSSAAVTR